MRARLIVESGVASPRVCELGDNDVVLLGRSRENTILLQDRHASRSHARVFVRDGCFFIGHQETTNGTKVDGRNVECDTPLADGQLITIGEVQIRFLVMADEPPDEPSVVDAGDLDPGDSTLFQADELTALMRFMNEPLAEATPHRLVNRALEIALVQTGADLAGFLGLEPGDPELHLVVPAQASLDRNLSQRLTQEVLRGRSSIWLCAPGSQSPHSDSLSDFHDALCIPLRAGAGELPLGALHVYKTTRPFSERQVRFCEVLAGNLGSALQVLRSRRALEADNRRLRKHASAAGNELVGSSPDLVRLRQRVRTLADGPCTVLIHGESGTGKELVALGLHGHSARHAGPLVTVNCAAINGSMAESELFGHVRGAFTGAVRDHAGYFAQADMGTLFLDEIGELSQDLQAKLLRAIEYRSFRPVGAQAEVRADVRIIAATNRDLEREVREGRFRRDLFFRLTSRINVPALREHPEDVPELVEHFLRLFAVEYRKRVTLSEAALERLMSFSWPGNVRQLRSVLEGAVAMAGDGDVIHAGDLHLVTDPLASPPADCPASLNLEELEQWAIRHALAQTGGNVLQAARLLGIHRETLGLKLKKYGIEKRGEMRA
jgi:Nif-specific regulatory protein